MGFIPVLYNISCGLLFYMQQQLVPLIYSHLNIASPLFMSTDFMEVILRDSVPTCFLQGRISFALMAKGGLLFY